MVILNWHEYSGGPGLTCNDKVVEVVVCSHADGEVWRVVVVFSFLLKEISNILWSGSELGFWWWVPFSEGLVCCKDLC